MAKINTIVVDKGPLDRSLIEYIFAHRSECPDWKIEKDDLKFSLSVPWITGTFSLLIKSADEERLIAVIPENEPFTIKLFDKSEKTYQAIHALVEGFESDKAITIWI